MNNLTHVHRNQSIENITGPETNRARGFAGAGIYEAGAAFKWIASDGLVYLKKKYLYLV